VRNRKSVFQTGIYSGFVQCSDGRSAVR